MSFPVPDSSLEELEARHRREKKDLAAKLMALKKTVTKGDKRKKKEVAAEIALLEAELNDRHAAEVKQFGMVSANQQNDAPGAAGPVDADADAEAALVAAVSNVSISDPDPVSASNADAGPSSDQPQQAAPLSGLYASKASTQSKLPGSKKNKAKLRQQRKEEEMRRLQEEADAEAENMVDVAAQESEAIEKLVAQDGLVVHDIRADGHCLYSAFADQVNTYHGSSSSFQDMRCLAAQYMRQHRDDFMPFMVTDCGDMFTDADFERYCDRIESTADWGGHQEITALSHALQTPVFVYQTGMSALRIGDDLYSSKAPVNLSYHRHAYGLGEHYNSLRKAQP
ncbi:OTU protein [Coemansia sp. IMI 203386]|nr:OTU protein [Coemansia sp. IMI 203386]